MSNKQQMSFSLVFLAVAIILQAGQATARRKLLEAEVGVTANPTLEMLINEMIGVTERAKGKVPVLGNSQMVKDCDKAYASSLDNLNKAKDLLKGTLKDGELKATILAALHDYDNCDFSFAQSTRPSPFIPNNDSLKYLASKCLSQFTSN